MATTLEGSRLLGVKVIGESLSADLVESCAAASLSASTSQVTELAFSFNDDPDLRVFRSGMLSQGATVTYGGWVGTVQDVGVRPGPLGPVMEVKAPSKYVTALRAQTGAANWGTADVSAWVGDRATEAGMDTIIQPGLGSKLIVRAKPDGQTSDSTWDVITALATEVGCWVFEYGSILVFAKPSWLVQRPGQRYWSLVWSSWDNYSAGLAGMPVYSNRGSSAPRETITFRLVSADADTIRPGDPVILSGTGAGPMRGTWIATAVGFPLHRAGEVRVDCVRPLDPAPQPKDTPAPAASAGSAAASGGAPAGLAAAVDRYVNTVNGQTVDIDGANGGQCVDLVAHYTLQAIGGGNVFGNGKDWYTSPTALASYTQISASAPAQKGDVACWGPAWGGGYGHVAIVLEDLGGSLKTLSQNPGPAHIMTLGKDGLQGYLRPTTWR
ncbi:CHAP domain-containing protein [Pseudarthrobacter sp. P1]|uniref:CHAP domain-containing protein n=1 Tax=Pseudarthrobacter sp. P1 TaxID=3418418 RepID=UPI003CFB75B9